MPELNITQSRSTYVQLRFRLSSAIMVRQEAKCALASELSVSEQVAVVSYTEANMERKNVPSSLSLDVSISFQLLKVPELFAH